MNESILRSVAKYIGVGTDDDFYDPELIMIINAGLAILHQLGVLKTNQFTIEDEDKTWSDILIDDTRLDDARLYVGIRTKLIFDPPSNSFLVNTLTETFKEIEWRLGAALDDMDAEGS